MTYVSSVHDPLNPEERVNHYILMRPKEASIQHWINQNQHRFYCVKFQHIQHYLALEYILVVHPILYPIVRIAVQSRL